MTGASIAAEIEAAYREAAFTVTLIESATQPQNPWDDPAGSPTSYTIRAVIDGK